MDNKYNPVGFQLLKVTTEQFAIVKESFNCTNEQVELSIGLRFGLDVENKQVACFFNVQFLQDEKPFIILELAYHFVIQPESWESFLKGDNKIVLPNGFASHLTVLTIGGIRGVLHAKTEDTEFNKFLLPTVNVNELFSGDVELNY